MASGQLSGVIQHLRRIVGWPTDGGLTDGQLLDRFVSQREEAAFAALLQRHGPLVLGLCRRVLGNASDADDVFQATFLVLVRKAGSIRKRESVASWLYGVAYRLAQKARADAAQRHAHERQIVDMPASEPTCDTAWQELWPVVDDALKRLPEKYRAPLILCYLQGKTHLAASQQLGWPKGTVSTRLRRALERLRLQLAGRGLALSAALLATLLAENAARAPVPTALADSTIKVALLLAMGEAAASGAISAQATALMEGALKAMSLTKLKIAAVVFLALAATSAGVGVLAHWALAAGQAVSQPKAALVQTLQEPDVAEAAHQKPLAGNGDARREDPVTEAKNRARSRLSLKHLARAMQNYESAYARFPAPAIYEGGGFGGFGGGALGLGGGAGLRGFGGGALGLGGGALGLGGGAGLRGFGGGALGLGGGGLGGFSGGALGLGGGAGLGGMGAGGALAGKALLSWRVTLLPYLNEGELYNQFRLNEPWDSPHNKKLLAKMPKVYAPVGVPTKVPYSTYYQVFVGEGAAFEKKQSLHLKSFVDGTANTVMIVEAGSAVPWTKPEDLHYAADEPLPELGGLFKDVFHAAFCDGSVHTLRKQFDEKMMRLAITRNDGQLVDFDKLEAPGTNGMTEAGVIDAAQLQQQNERLKKDLAQARAELASMKEELELLQELAGGRSTPRRDAKTANLQAENARLRQALRKTRIETEELRLEWEKMKSAVEKRLQNK